MKSITFLDTLTWLGGLAVQTFLKAFFILLLLNGVIDLILVRILDSYFLKYVFGGGLVICLLLAWLYLQWKMEPPVLIRSVLGVVPLLLGMAAFMLTGSWSWWLVVMAGYVGWAIWAYFFRTRYLRTVMQYWKAGEASQALSALDQYIELHSSANDAYQYRAWVRLDRAQYIEAEQDIQAALQLKPRSYFSKYLLGRIRLEQGQLSLAKEAFLSAVHLGPGRGISYLSLGIIYYIEADHSLALETLSKGIGWGFPNPSNFMLAYYYIGRILDSFDQSALSSRAYQLMAKFQKGYDQLVAALESEIHTNSPTSDLYRSDLPDMKRHLDSQKYPSS